MNRIYIIAKPSFGLLLAMAYGCAAMDRPREGVGPLSISHSVSQEQVALQHRSVVTNGVKLHYVVAGHGDPVVLIPGWPQSWYAWRFVIPEMVSAGRRVYALDPRGFGDSEKPPTGYDPATSANDLHSFLVALGLSDARGVDIVAHDVGTWIAFAHAATFPEDVRRLVVTEALIPGVLAPPNGIPDRAANIKTWHFSFNRLDGLPEILVQGHERAFLEWLFSNKSIRGWTIDAPAVDEYVRVFSSPGASRAGFAYYRGFLDDVGLAQIRAASARKLAMPVLALGGEGGVGNGLLTTMQPLADDVRGGILQGCGHYLPEECPAEFTRAVLDFWRSTHSSPDNK